MSGSRHRLLCIAFALAGGVVGCRASGSTAVVPAESSPAAPAASPTSTRPPCEVALAETPSALFGVSALVRLPEGIELVERSNVEVGSVSSDSRSCESPISSVSVVVADTDVSRSLHVNLGEAVARLVERGLAQPDEEQVFVDVPRQLIAQYSFAREDGATVRVLFAAHRGDTRTFMISYSVAAVDFGRLAETLLESAKSLVANPDA